MKDNIYGASFAFSAVVEHAARQQVMHERGLLPTCQTSCSAAAASRWSEKCLCTMPR